MTDKLIKDSQPRQASSFFLRQVRRPLLAAVLTMSILLLAMFLFVTFKVTEADAATFWSKTCGIELPEYRGGRVMPMARLKPKRGNWYRYYLQYEHDGHDYKVAADQVEARASAVAGLLNQPIASTKSEECQWSAQACENVLKFKNSMRLRCLDRLNIEHGNVLLFLQHISEEGWRTD